MTSLAPFARRILLLLASSSPAVWDSQQLLPNPLDVALLPGPEACDADSLDRRDRNLLRDDVTMQGHQAAPKSPPRNQLSFVQTLRLSKLASPIRSCSRPKIRDFLATHTFAFARRRTNSSSSTFCNLSFQNIGTKSRNRW
jgi:hypothetical protein